MFWRDALHRESGRKYGHEHNTATDAEKPRKKSGQAARAGQAEGHEEQVGSWKCHRVTA